jgi:hypothetical protein
MIAVTVKLDLVSLYLIRLMGVMFIVKKIKDDLVEKQVEC